MTFTTLQIPNADGHPITVDASVLRITDGCLAIQRSPFADGYCYEALHVPTGGTMSRYAFLDPLRARDALVDFWARLTIKQRNRLCLADDVATINADAELTGIFRKAWRSKAEIEFTEEEKPLPAT